jgi:hypothetical protein
MANIDRLIDAGMIDPSKARTQEQDDAIESLTEDEVDHLISARNKLSPWISDSDDIIHLPGIPQN